MMRTACFLLALGLFACSNDTPSRTDTGGDGGGDGGVGGVGGMPNGGGGTGGDPCAPPSFTAEDVTEQVGMVSGMVLDLTGAPAPMVLSDVCGTNVCIAGATDATGAFALSGRGADVVDARLVYGDGLTHAKMAGRVPSLPDAMVGTIHTPRLPAFADGVMLVPGEEASQGGVTLTIPAGAQISHDIILYDEAERGLRATLFAPTDGRFPAIGTDLNVEVVIGLAPIHSLVCPAASLSFTNAAGWEPGAEVEILFNNVEIFTSFAPYGDWAVVAEATVSTDGSTVSTNDGEGIVELGTLAARLK